MKPGDLVRCPSCGREATAYTTGDPAAWTPDRPLLVSWEGYRHEVLPETPAPCLLCLDGSQPRPAPTRRVAICDDLARHGCRSDGFEWATDADVEDAYQRWISAGRPRLALVAVHPLPSVAGTGPLTDRSEASGTSTAPCAQVGSKARSERPRAQLGLF